VNKLVGHRVNRVHDGWCIPPRWVLLTELGEHRQVVQALAWQGQRHACASLRGITLVSLIDTIWHVAVETDIAPVSAWTLKRVLSLLTEPCPRKDNGLGVDLDSDRSDELHPYALAEDKDRGGQTRARLAGSSDHSDYRCAWDDLCLCLWITGGDLQAKVSRFGKVRKGWHQDLEETFRRLNVSKDVINRGHAGDDLDKSIMDFRGSARATLIEEESDSDSSWFNDIWRRLNLWSQAHLTSG